MFCSRSVTRRSSSQHCFTAPAASFSSPPSSHAEQFMFGGAIHAISSRNVLISANSPGPRHRRGWGTARRARRRASADVLGAVEDRRCCPCRYGQASVRYLKRWSAIGVEWASRSSSGVPRRTLTWPTYPRLLQLPGRFSWRCSPGCRRTAWVNDCCRIKTRSWRRASNLR